jgi:tyrosyl-tRNA synthetase
LAKEVTSVVHGADAWRSAEAAADLLFGADPSGAPVEVLETLAGEVPSSRHPSDSLDLVGLLVATGLASSISDARRGLGQQAYSVNGTKVTPDRVLGTSDLLRGRFLLLAKGKRTYHLAEIVGLS